MSFFIVGLGNRYKKTLQDLEQESPKSFDLYCLEWIKKISHSYGHDYGDLIKETQI